MTAKRDFITKDTDLLSLFGPAPTDEQRKLAQEAMRPYMAAFQAAANEQTARDFGVQPDAFLPPLALETAREILSSARTEQQVALVVASHVKPMSEMLAQLASSVAPLMALLEESRRQHAYHCNTVFENGKCTCGADEWNAKVDAALGRP